MLYFNSVKLTLHSIYHTWPKTPLGIKIKLYQALVFLAKLANAIA